MNAKRTAPSSNGVRLGSLVWIVVFISIFAVTGITWSLLVNQKIKVDRQISSLNGEIEMFQNDIDQFKSRINEKLGHFEIKSRLAAGKSQLAPLVNGQVEIINESVVRRSRGLASTSR